MEPRSATRASDSSSPASRRRCAAPRARREDRLRGSLRGLLDSHGDLLGLKGSQRDRVPEQQCLTTPEPLLEWLDTTLRELLRWGVETIQRDPPDLRSSSDLELYLISTPDRSTKTAGRGKICHLRGGDRQTRPGDGDGLSVPQAHDETLSWYRTDGCRNRRAGDEQPQDAQDHEQPNHLFLILPPSARISWPSRWARPASFLQRHQ